MEIFKKILGIEHPDYIASLLTLIGYYSQLDNKDEIKKLDC